jgi:hypothetical protein
MSGQQHNAAESLRYRSRQRVFLRTVTAGADVSGTEGGSFLETTRSRAARGDDALRIEGVAALPSAASLPGWRREAPMRETPASANVKATVSELDPRLVRKQA